MYWRDYVEEIKDDEEVSNPWVRCRRSWGIKDDEEEGSKQARDLDSLGGMKEELAESSEPASLRRLGLSKAWGVREVSKCSPV